MSERVAAAAVEVYGVPPKDFVATRTRLVREAKEAGDKDAAKQIGALRRPNTAAWLVNLLVREAADQIAALLDLGAAMRHAQARLSAQELRRLTVQRQQVVRALASTAHSLAAELGEQVSRDALHQVADTLQAGLADPEIAEQIRQGQLTQPLSYSGFGPAGLRAVPEPAAEPSAAEPEPAAETKAQAAARAELERRRAEAKEAVEAAARKVVKANRSVVTAKAAQRRADRELGRAEQSVAERQEALDEALALAERARARVQASEGERASADDALAEAERALQRAKKAAAALEE